MKKFLGNIIYKLSRFIDLVLGFIIDVMDKLLALMNMMGRALLGFIAVLFFFLMMFMFGGIFGILLLPKLFKLIFIFVVIPFLAGYILDALRFLRYGLTEYLYDRANNLIDGQAMRLESFMDYFREYIKIKEEKRIRREEERQRAEQERRRAEEEAWRRFFEANYRTAGQGASYGGGSFDLGFKEKYEKSCDILEIGYQASKEEIRKAYRAKAKKYHPDLNKEEGATERFQEINLAHDFLSEENIERYRKLN